MSRISQKVMEGFGQDLMDGVCACVCQEQTDYILVKILIRIVEFFKRFFTIERWGPKIIHSTISQKVMDGIGRNLVDIMGV